MCLSDTEKGFQTQKRLNNPSLVGAPKCRDRNKFPQAGQIAINGDWNRRTNMLKLLRNLRKREWMPAAISLALR